MGSNSTVSSARRSGRRRLLAPSQKYEMFVSVLTGQYTQREAAEKWKVDRTTVNTFTEALEVEDLWAAADQRATAALVAALASGDSEALESVLGHGQRPLLLAISDNGPQMRSHTTREFLAGVAIAQQFGRPGTPQDQAWIETLFGHVKGEWPHLEKITDPGELEAELDLVRAQYNAVRLHAGIGYVTPNDEHEGRGDAIRTKRRNGLARARENRIAYRRTTDGAHHGDNQ